LRAISLLATLVVILGELVGKVSHFHQDIVACSAMSIKNQMPPTQSNKLAAIEGTT
jgi:hypothetical protein